MGGSSRSKRMRSEKKNRPDGTTENKNMAENVDEKTKNKMPLFEELRKTSREKFESDSDSNISRDVFIHSSKRGM